MPRRGCGVTPLTRFLLKFPPLEFAFAIRNYVLWPTKKRTFRDWNSEWSLVRARYLRFLRPLNIVLFGSGRPCVTYFNRFAKKGIIPHCADRSHEIWYLLIHVADDWIIVVTTMSIPRPTGPNIDIGKPEVFQAYVLTIESNENRSVHAGGMLDIILHRRCGGVRKSLYSTQDYSAIRDRWDCYDIRSGESFLPNWIRHH